MKKYKRKIKQVISLILALIIGFELIPMKYFNHMNVYAAVDAAALAEDIKNNWYPLTTLGKSIDIMRNVNGNVRTEPDGEEEIEYLTSNANWSQVADYLKSSEEGFGIGTDKYDYTYWTMPHIQNHVLYINNKGPKITETTASMGVSTNLNSTDDDYFFLGLVSEIKNPLEEEDNFNKFELSASGNNWHFVNPSKDYEPKVTGFILVVGPEYSDGAVEGGTPLNTGVYYLNEQPLSVIGNTNAAWSKSFIDEQDDDNGTNYVCYKQYQNVALGERNNIPYRESYCDYATTDTGFKKYTLKIDATTGNIYVIVDAFTSAKGIKHDETTIFVGQTDYAKGFSGWSTVGEVSKRNGCFSGVTGTIDSGVDYIINHYYQDNNGNYSNPVTETLHGVIGDYVTPELRPQEGYNLPSKQTVEISNNTVINYYYGRKVYAVMYNKNKPYNSTYDVNGNIEPILQFWDASITLNTGGYNLKGWQFVGWRENNANIGTIYPSNKSISYGINYADKTINMYAQWEPNTYKVKYNSNKPSSATGTIQGSTTTSTHTYDTAQNLTTNGYTLDGWVFTGWNTKADGTGVSYADKESVKNLTSVYGLTVNLYAQWKPCSYNIIFNGNGNTSGSKSNETAYFDTTKEIASNNNQSAYKKSYTVTYNLNEDKHVNDTTLKKVTLNPLNTTVTQNWNVNGYFVNKNELYNNATIGSTSTNKNLLDKVNNSYPNTYNISITNKLIANNRVYNKSDVINGTYKIGNINYKDTNYAWISTKNLINFYVRNLKILGDITMYASYEPVELTLPSASRGDDAVFLGWFTVAQNDYAAIKSGIEHWKNEGNTNLSAYDLYYVGQPGEKFCVDENTTLYAWWNKQPTYVDIHEGVFFEGQTVTYDDLIQLVSVVDYEEDADNEYYIDLSTTYVDLVIKTVTEEYQNQLDIINAEIATKEANHYTAGTEAYYSNKEALNELYTRKNNITTEMNNKITELKSGNIDSSIRVKSIYYKATNDISDVNGDTTYVLDTKTDNIGEVEIIYTVTDNGIICGTTKLEPITQDYTRKIEIKMNYNPLLYTSNIINYTTDTYIDPSGKYNGLGEYLVYMQSIKDSEDNRNNNPWWNSTSDVSNLRNVSNADTKAKLESSIIITGIQNITYLPQYYYKVDNNGNYVYKDLLDSFTNDYTFNDSSTNRTADVNNLYTNAQNYNGVNVWEMIQSMDIIFDGKDQWGKYSSDRVSTEASVKDVKATNNADYTQSEVERTSKFILINVNMDEALITTNVAEKSRYISEKYINTLENNSYWNTNSKELEEILNRENKNATSLQEFTINQNQTNETKIKIYDYTN